MSGHFRIVLVLFSMLSVPILAQENYTLQLIDQSRPSPLKKINYKKSFYNSDDRKKEFRKVMYTLYEMGYMAARIDSVKNDTINKILWLNTGPVYKWGTINIGPTEKSFLSSAGLRQKDFPADKFTPASLSRFMQSLLLQGENNGYPFMSVQLDSLSFQGEIFSAKLVIDKGPLIYIDSIVVKGKAKISTQYLSQHLGISAGDLYNESKVKAISTRIKEISFVKEVKPFEIRFIKDKATIKLFLDKKRSSQFDGIIGFLPDNVTKKTIITGDIRLKLLNAIGRGELLEFNWRQLQVQTQDLKAAINYPYLFQSNYCADARFKLFKKDTSWLEVNPVIGIEYRMSGKQSIRGFLDRKELSLLSTSGFSQLPSLPPNADVHSTQYGLSLKLEDLDYRFNPRTGYSMILTGKAGNKKIIRNAGIGDALYENLDLNTSVYTGELELKYFVPLWKRGVLMTGVKAAGLLADNIFQNELFRIGGLNSVRGFDEESMNASAYGIGTFELRYLLEQNSYAYIFSDGGYYENYSLNGSTDAALFSVGTGISFETKAGIFTLSYALGSQIPNPLDFRSGKVHFGIIGLF